MLSTFGCVLMGNRREKALSFPPENGITRNFGFDVGCIRYIGALD